jgi:sugar phosphate isomerase/epimerase
LGYWLYREFGTLLDLMREVKATLPAIEQLARETDMTAALHLHSGKFLTANPAVVWWLLEGHDPDFLGAYIDPGHMVIEGGSNGWMQGMDLLADKIRLVAVKDFGWEPQEDPQTGETRWRLLHLPLKRGMVPWREVFRLLRRIGFQGPVSLHSEYGDLSLDELLAQTKEDLEYVRSLLAEEEG